MKQFVCRGHQVHALEKGGDWGSHTWQSSLGRAADYPGKRNWEQHGFNSGAQTTRISEGHTGKWANGLSFLWRQTQQNRVTSNFPYERMRVQLSLWGPLNRGKQRLFPNIHSAGKEKKGERVAISWAKRQEQTRHCRCLWGRSRSSSFGGRGDSCGRAQGPTWGGGQGWDLQESCCLKHLLTSVCTISSLRLKLLELGKERLSVNYYKIKAFVQTSW